MRPRTCCFAAYALPLLSPYRTYACLPFNSLLSPLYCGLNLRNCFYLAESVARPPRQEVIPTVKESTARIRGFHYFYRQLDKNKIDGVWAKQP